MVVGIGWLVDDNTRKSNQFSSNFKLSNKKHMKIGKKYKAL